MFVAQSLIKISRKFADIRFMRIAKNCVYISMFSTRDKDNNTENVVEKKSTKVSFER